MLGDAQQKWIIYNLYSSFDLKSFNHMTNFISNESIISLHNYIKSIKSELIPFIFDESSTVILVYRIEW